MHLTENIARENISHQFFYFPLSNTEIRKIKTVSQLVFMSFSYKNFHRVSEIVFPKIFYLYYRQSQVLVMSLSASFFGVNLILT